MDYRKINSHIILMSVGIILSIIIATISRFVVISKGFDTGTANLTFIIVLSILIIIYLIILSTLAHTIVPWIMKKLPEPKKDISESVPEDIPNKKENLEELESQEQIIEESIPAQTIESIIHNSEKHYIDKLNNKIGLFLEYAHLTMAAYITEEELLSLDEYIKRYAREESLPKDIIPLNPNKLKNPDMFHFGWNMAHYFGFQKQEVVPWLQKVFADLKELEPSTIKGKLYDYQKEKYIIPNIDDIPKHLEKVKG